MATYTLIKHGMIRKDDGGLIGGNAELFEYNYTSGPVGAALATGALAALTGIWSLSYASADTTKEYVVVITPTTASSTQRRYVLMNNEDAPRELYVIGTASVGGPLSVVGNLGVTGTLLVTGATTLVGAVTIPDSTITPAKIANRTRTLLLPFTDVSGGTIYTAVGDFRVGGWFPVDYDRTQTATAVVVVISGGGGTISPSFSAIVGASGEGATVSVGGSPLAVSANKLFTLTGTITFAANTYDPGDYMFWAATISPSGASYYPVGILFTYTADS